MQPGNDDSSVFLSAVIALAVVGSLVLWFSCGLYERLGFSVGWNILATVGTWFMFLLLSICFITRVLKLDKRLLKGSLGLTFLFSAPVLFFVILFTVIGYGAF
mgnify:CR=1 FL=1|jgi:hypothetical protein